MDLKKLNNSPTKQEKKTEYLKDIKEIKKRNKVYIVGFAPSVEEVKWGLKDFDYWGINELYMEARGKRFDAWFEIHDIKDSPSKQAKYHQSFLKNCHIPLVTQKHWDEYPMSMPYPREEVKAFVNKQFITTDGGAGYSDYSNQIAWMVALAIYLGYEEIHLYGVDMAQKSEYQFQKSSCHFFLGFAAGKGTMLKVPASCELLKGSVDYGFESDNANRHRKKSRITSLNKQAKQVKLRQAEICYWIDEVLEETRTKNELVTQEKLTDLNKLRMKTTNQTKLAELDKLQKEIENTYNETKKQTFINIKVLEEEYEKNEITLAEIRGLINECNHDLNNNLV